VRRGLTAALLVLAVLVLPGAAATFRGTTGTAANTLAAAGNFAVGGLWEWGGDTPFTPVPYRVDNAVWASAASGPKYGCGVRTDGTLWCWGRNASGRLGLSDTTDRAAPVQVGAGTDFACALKTDTTLWCWGENSSGQLGTGDPSRYLTSPDQVTVPAATDWRSVALGDETTCGVRLDNTLFCWGRNNNDQVGDGTTTNALAPRQVTAVVGVRLIDSGPASDFALAQVPN